VTTTYRRVDATLILILSDCKTWCILGCFRIRGDCPIIPPRLLPELSRPDEMMMSLCCCCKSYCKFIIVCSELCPKSKGLVHIYHYHSLHLDRVKYWKAKQRCNDNKFTPQSARKLKPVRCGSCLWSPWGAYQYIYMWIVMQHRYCTKSAHISAIRATNRWVQYIQM